MQQLLLVCTTRHNAAFHGPWKVKNHADLPISAGVLTARLRPKGCLKIAEQQHARLLVKVWVFLLKPLRQAAASALFTAYDEACMRQLAEHAN
jgi:hypothetical protein